MGDRWVKLYEKIEDSSIYHDSELVHLWVHLMIKASKFGNKFPWNGGEMELKPGQLLTGRKKLHDQTGISESKIQRSLKRFEKCHMIEQQTTNKNRIITVLNWDKYQSSEQQMNSQRTGNEQVTNNERTGNEHNQERKKDKKEESKNKEYSEDSKEFRMSLFLFNEIRKRKPDYKKPDFQKWSIQSDYILRIDRRDMHEVKKVVEWCQTDEFWQDNILSIAKLRKQYDKLVLKMNKNGPGNGQSNKMQEMTPEQLNDTSD